MKKVNDTLLIDRISKVHRNINFLRSEKSIPSPLKNGNLSNSSANSKRFSYKHTW